MDLVSMARALVTEDGTAPIAPCRISVLQIAADMVYARLEIAPATQTGLGKIAATSRIVQAFCPNSG